MAQYPTAAGTDANLFITANNLSTSLTGAHTNVITTITVASTTGFPTAGYITIDAEAIAYTGTTGTTFTGCTRGADGTAAASHLNAAQVQHDVVAAHHNVLKDEIKAIETDLVASYTGGSTSIATTFAKYLKLIGGALTGALTSSSYFQGTSTWATGNTGPASGVGVQTGYASTRGFIQAYDIAGAVYKDLQVSTSKFYADNGSATTYLTAQASGVSMLGTNTNDSAAAGNVGEYVSSSVVTAANFPATGVIGDATSINLTAGDWDVSCQLDCNTSGVASVTYCSVGISTTTGNSSTGLTQGTTQLYCQASGGQQSISIPRFRASISSTTTYFLKVTASFSGTTPQYVGMISARRMR